MKIYTRTGDEGQTGLPGGTRLPKDAGEIEFCGTLDEFNTFLGAARATPLPGDIDQILEEVQHLLFDMGAEVAGTPRAEPGGARVGAERVRWAEEAIDRYQAELPPLHDFILPGGEPASAALHIARAVCRRAERRLVHLAQATAPRDLTNHLACLNRLSDLLFVLARVANARAGCPDTIWRKGRR
jgi:cob(I)alamin adenosyltransferase